jgi:hypothetical protein
VEPTALFFRCTKDLAQRMPEAQSTIPNCQVRRVRETAPLQINQQLSPTLGAFATVISKTDNLFTALLVCAYQNQNTFFSSAMRGRK